MQVNFHLKSVNDNKWLTNKAIFSLIREQRDTKRLPDYLGGGAAIGGLTASLVAAGTEDKFLVRPTDGNIHYNLHHLTRSKVSFHQDNSRGEATDLFYLK